MVSPLNTPTDSELIDRCRGGDAQAWRLLVQRYQRLVYAVALRAGLDEAGAADVFQTVFERLLKHVETLSQPDRLQAWIVTTAKRESLRMRELARRNVSLSRDDEEEGEAPENLIADDAPLAESVLEDLQQLHLLRLAFDHLDERCRELLTLVFRDEDDHLPYAEVGRRLGIPTGSVGPTRVRCLDKLRQLASARGAG